ncbi:uncharacterized protein F5147DRAFT_762610 [Suillus discolor]|uniref:Uncharacterized protein n=1 Tax=Suillus discolor TaxID=1912936 RepID=A0A9P7F1C9_9AGAM|nr:uncharacterized protein F5147DRAFT_762610 [Suillus discolor]KAG2101832.1 hypothetical protein F5147DRAFT_762610 [Suillus discolor]
MGETEVKYLKGARRQSTSVGVESVHELQVVGTSMEARLLQGSIPKDNNKWVAFKTVRDHVTLEGSGGGGIMFRLLRVDEDGWEESKLLLRATGVKLTGVDSANAGKLDSDDGFPERSVVGACRSYRRDASDQRLQLRIQSTRTNRLDGIDKLSCACCSACKELVQALSNKAPSGKHVAMNIITKSGGQDQHLSNLHNAKLCIVLVLVAHHIIRGPCTSKEGLKYQAQYYHQEDGSSIVYSHGLKYPSSMLFLSNQRFSEDTDKAFSAKVNLTAFRLLTCLWAGDPPGQDYDNDQTCLVATCWSGVHSRLPTFAYISSEQYTQLYLTALYYH